MKMDLFLLIHYKRIVAHRESTHSTKRGFAFLAGYHTAMFGKWCEKRHFLNKNAIYK
jgi:hypothetical protein